jgi:hypothetical protein
MAGLAVVENTINTDSFNGDASLANLVSFDINYGDVTYAEPVLTLTFSDVVNTSTFNPVAITLQSAKKAKSGLTHVLSSSSTIITPNASQVIKIQLDRLDKLKLDSTNGLGDGVSTTFLTMTATAFDDIYGRDVIAVTDGNALQVKNFVADELKPFVEQFLVILSNSTLELHFSEAVNASTFHPDELIIQSQKDQDSSHVLGLSSSTKVLFSSDKRTITLALTDDDSNFLKLDDLMGTNRSNFFISHSSRLIRDYVGLPTKAIEKEAGLQAASVTEDKKDPIIDSFSMNMNDGKLSLTFSEVIRVHRTA